MYLKRPSLLAIIVGESHYEKKYYHYFVMVSVVLFVLWAWSSLFENISLAIIRFKNTKSRDTQSINQCMPTDTSWLAEEGRGGAGKGGAEWVIIFLSALLVIWLYFDCTAAMDRRSTHILFQRTTLTGSVQQSCRIDVIHSVTMPQSQSNGFYFGATLTFRTYASRGQTLTDGSKMLWRTGNNRGEGLRNSMPYMSIICDECITPCTLLWTPSLLDFIIFCTQRLVLDLKSFQMANRLMQWLAKCGTQQPLNPVMYSLTRMERATSLNSWCTTWRAIADGIFMPQLASNTNTLVKETKCKLLLGLPSLSVVHFGKKFFSLSTANKHYSQGWHYFLWSKKSHYRQQAQLIFAD